MDRAPAASPDPPAVSVYYGEDIYPAYICLQELQAALSDPDPPPIERFDLAGHGWNEILEEARSPSLLFGSGRILLIESPPRKRGNVPSPFENISDRDKADLAAYLSAPSPSVRMVILYPGKIRPNSPLIRFFSGFAPQVRVKELKALKDRNLVSWVERRVAARSKRISEDAARRLIDLVGNDLRALDNEIDKVVTYVGGGMRVEEEDVDQVSGSIKSVVEWELSDFLEGADYRQCLVIVQKLLDQEGGSPLQILGLVAGFFHNVLLAKLRLAEGRKDKKAIFREIKPHIRESFGGLYKRQFRQLFSLAEGLSWQDLEHIQGRLRELDLRIKSTGLDFQPLMEGFLFEYCRLRGSARDARSPGS